MNSIRKQCLVATAGVVAVWSSPALAQESAPPPTSSAGAGRGFNAARERGLHRPHRQPGYSTNPFLEIGDSQSSAYGRLSARGVHAWGGERSRSSISAFVEGTGYLNDYGFESIFSVTGDTLQQVSEKVSLFGSAGVERRSCRAVEQSLPLRPAAPASAGPEPCRLRLSRSTIRTSSPSRAASTEFMDRPAGRSG